MRGGVYAGFMVFLLLLAGCSGDITQEKAAFLNDNQTEQLEPDPAPEQDNNNNNNNQGSNNGPTVNLSSLGSCDQTASEAHCEDYAMLSTTELEDELKRHGGQYTAQELVDLYIENLSQNCENNQGNYSPDGCLLIQRSHSCAYKKDLGTLQSSALPTERNYYHEDTVDLYEVSDMVTKQEFYYQNGVLKYRYRRYRDAEVQDKRTEELLTDLCSDVNGNLEFED